MNHIWPSRKLVSILTVHSRHSLSRLPRTSVIAHLFSSADLIRLSTSEPVNFYSPSSIHPQAPCTSLLAYVSLVYNLFLVYADADTPLRQDVVRIHRLCTKNVPDHCYGPLKNLGLVFNQFSSEEAARVAEDKSQYAKMDELVIDNIQLMA